MTFESMLDNAKNETNVTSMEQPEGIIKEETRGDCTTKGEAQAVKISFGDDIRRVSASGWSYAAFCELAAKLFALDQRAVVLKYQDDDGDKITMTSDCELQDAFKFAKDRKLLRLFVESKPIPFQEGCQSVASTHGPFPQRFGQQEHTPSPGLGFRHKLNALVNMARSEQAAGLTAHFHAPRVFSHGTFYPADAVPVDSTQWVFKEQRRDAKEHKQVMKQHVKVMKTNASTPEAFLAIKEFKKRAQAEFKAKCQNLDKDCKDARFVARHVADLTIPDNSELPKDTSVTKTWRLRNAGEVAWPADSHLIFLSSRGDNLNGPERVFVGTVEPHQEVDVSISFVTPSLPGRYTGYYRMASADGPKFGQRLWVSFIVAKSPESESIEIASAPLEPVDDVASVASAPPMDTDSAPPVYSAPLVDTAAANTLVPVASAPLEANQ